MKTFDFFVSYLTIIVGTLAVVLLMFGCGIDPVVNPEIYVVPPAVIDDLPELGCSCPDLDLSKFVLVPKL